MAGKKQKCPDCSTKLKKNEDDQGRHCPECFLVIDESGTIYRVNPDQDNGGQDEDQSISNQSDPPGGQDEGGGGTKGDQADQPGTDPGTEDPGPGSDVGPGPTTDFPPGKWDINHVSKGLQAFESIDVYAWPIGVRGYRFGTKCPYISRSLKKKMSGVEAYQFLRHIKRSNRRRVLEAKRLPDDVKFE